MSGSITRIECADPGLLIAQWGALPEPPRPPLHPPGCADAGLCLCRTMPAIPTTAAPFADCGLSCVRGGRAWSSGKGSPRAR